MRGRRPLPTHLKLVRGNPGKRRLNRNEPKPPAAMPEPPPHLDRRAVEEWNRVAPQLGMLGLLSDLDVAVLAAYCQAHSTLVTCSYLLADMAVTSASSGLIVKAGNGTAIPSPLIGIANRARADVVRYAVELGMTPSARSRIDTDKSKVPCGPDPADEFLA